MASDRKLKDLWTVWGEALTQSDALPWDVYPRPKMVRDSYINLNGWWDFEITQDVRMPIHFSRKIRVPFAPESALSGIHEPVPDGSCLWYRRKVGARLKKGQRLLLHIGAADQETTLWIHQTRVKLISGYAKNEYTYLGGYEPFTFDITAYLEDAASDGADFQTVNYPDGRMDTEERYLETEILIQVRDQLAGGKMPYGKQSLNPGGMWYTPVSGIWQSVWAEVVPDTYIKQVWTEAYPEDGIPQAGTVPGGRWIVRHHLEMSNGEPKTIEAFIDDPNLWSPEDPYLYDASLDAGEDRVETYFALRTISIGTVKNIPRLLLNGMPYFFHGLLDQGYWPDGLFTPADPEAYAWEIGKLKELGFNMLRKHIKIEPQLFYYECDRQGICVFQDMVQNGIYDYKHDTVLPTLGIQSLNEKNLHTDFETRENFIECMVHVVRELKEFPCIVYWTIFNEGWGQFSGTQMYMQLRHEDETRPIDTASGWFRSPSIKTDVESRHVYFKKVRQVRSSLPWVLSEFGGYACQIPDHVSDPDHVYGYRKFEQMEKLEEAVLGLYRKEILPLIPKGLCAAVYTQVSDIEDETNGIFTYDRKIQKLAAESFAELSAALKGSINDR